MFRRILIYALGAVFLTAGGSGNSAARKSKDLSSADLGKQITACR